MPKLKIKKGDQVVVLSGDDKGKTGEVVKAMPKENKVVVQGVNLVKRHTKPSQTTPGGIVTKEAAVQFAKRVLIGLIVFFIPTILDFFLSLISGASETSSKYNNCTNCILNPNNKNKCNPKGLTE